MAESSPRTATHGQGPRCSPTCSRSGSRRSGCALTTSNLSARGPCSSGVDTGPEVSSLLTFLPLVIPLPFLEQPRLVERDALGGGVFCALHARQVHRVL